MENAKIKSLQVTTAQAPVRRRRRVRGTSYTADEIYEIFRRFSVQRPEPKGELEHVNAFTIAKMIGKVDDITPARFSKGRRAHWPDAEAMYNSLRFKGLFKAFTETSFRNYQQHGLEPAPDGGVRLAFDPSVEVELFRNTPSDTWRYNSVLAMPRAVITGRDSEFYRGGTMTALAKRQRVPLELVVGAHMFPLEHPQETADLVRKHIVAMHNGTHESSKL